MVRKASDIKGFVRNHGYKMWIHKILRERGYDLEISWNEPRGEVQAYIHRDVWVAHCPTERCHGLIIVEPDEPMFCPDCHNANNDMHPYKVVFKHKDEVEALMGMRKNPQTRNWYPDETIEDLMLEQEVHGEL